MYLHIIYYVFAHYIQHYLHIIYETFPHYLHHTCTLSTTDLYSLYLRHICTLSTTYLHTIYDNYLRHIIYNTFTKKDSTDHHQNPSSHRAPPKRVRLFRAIGWDIGFCFEVTEQGLPVTSAFRALTDAGNLQYVFAGELAVGLAVETGVAIGFTQKYYGLFRANGWDIGSVLKRRRNKVFLWH